MDHSLCAVYHYSWTIYSGFLEIRTPKMSGLLCFCEKVLIQKIRIFYLIFYLFLPNKPCPKYPDFYDWTEVIFKKKFSINRRRVQHFDELCIFCKIAFVQKLRTFDFLFGSDRFLKIWTFGFLQTKYRCTCQAGF